MPLRSTATTNVPRYYGMKVKHHAPAVYHLGREPQLLCGGHYVRPIAGQKGVVPGGEERQKSIVPTWNSNPVSLTMPPAIRHTK